MTTFPPVTQTGAFKGLPSQAFSINGTPSGSLTWIRNVLYTSQKGYFVSCGSYLEAHLMKPTEPGGVLSFVVEEEEECLK